LGGTLMGDDPASSVTNSYGQTHQVENLFLAGASLFPTSGAVNPTGTLSSLAFRTADYIRDNRAALVP
jgi:choline dehydrogenase-like flavoprotein